MSSMGVNKVILVGNAGQDAEVKSTSTGKSVANFSLDVNEGFRDKSGKLVKRVEWVRCVAWQKLAEIAGNYVKKGKQVFVQGRLQTRQYQDSEGTAKTICEIVVTTLRVLGGGKNDGRGRADGDALPEPAADTQPQDIPF